MAKVYVSGIIDAPVEHVWAVARDFNGHGEWHPLIAESHIEEGRPSDQVGCIRNFKLTDGGHLREQLLAFSERDRSFTYNILVSPMPIENYVATFCCTPVTEGDKTFVEWSAEFDVAPQDEAEIKEKVGRSTFAEGIAALASVV
ncbi:SRPBCC family protein [Chelativorans sp. YIM 93263]|uniref:SRPBCC family protein n=1 Tax=Chelativorans sp. YIM 93263 TaxID=2906648 RepID=UPI002379F1B1|nr:SRPBCC family protein [Chelativorans sp. YIM 93263]